MKTHGMSETVEYRAWFEMKRRCCDHNRKCYNNYGGRGIKVCDRWNESFENFYEDMGDKPTPNHSLDRIDVDGDYTPDNCKWSDRTEQNYNQRYRGGVTNHPNIKTNGHTFRARVTRYKADRISYSFKDIEDAIKLRDQWLKEYEEDKEKWIEDTINKTYNKGCRLQ